MSDEFIKYLKKYERHFDDGFPTMSFRSTPEKEIIEMIDNCIKNNKDVYDMGYLNLEDIY